MVPTPLLPRGEQRHSKYHLSNAHRTNLNLYLLQLAQQLVQPPELALCSLLGRCQPRERKVPPEGELIAILAVKQPTTEVEMVLM